MWFIQPKKDYRKEIDWKYADEEELFSWQIRCRNYNTKSSNITLLMSIAFASLLPIYSVFDQGVGAASITFIGVLIILILLFMSGTHQTAIMVYRVTDNHIERVSWNPQIDSVRPILFIIAGVSLVVILGLTAISPKFLAGVIGPAGIALLALRMGTSGSYYNLQKDFREGHIEYECAEKIFYYPEKRIVFMETHWFNDDPNVMKNVVTNNAIFCTEDSYRKVLNYLEDKKPDIPREQSKYLDTFWC